MFELPEIANLAVQMNKTLAGKVIRRGSLGNSPHKFVWYNRKPAEFEKLTRGKKIGKACARGRWLFVPLLPGYVLVLGECGGKALFHPAGSPLPKKYHLRIEFEDGSSFTETTAMWGAMELYEKGKELQRQYIKGMRPTPIDREFTPDYFARLVKEVIAGEKRSAKGLLTQNQLIPGLGNSIAQDILFRAKIDPRRSRTVRQLASRWIPIYPSTDAALMLAMLYVWISEGLVDQAFVDRYSVGFAALQDYVLGLDVDRIPKSPAWRPRSMPS